MIAPLLLALPPEFRLATPSTSAFSGGDPAGGTTLISTPVTVCPPETETTLPGLDDPPPPVGAGVVAELGAGVELPPPPQPDTKNTMAAKLTSATPRSMQSLLENNPVSAFRIDASLQIAVVPLRGG